MADKPPNYPGYVSNEPQFQGYVSNEPQQFPGYVNTGQPQFQGYVNTGAPPPQNIVIVPGGGGACPYCRVGYPREEFSCCGIFLAIFFFPIGILCCLAMRETRCSHCGRSF